MKAVAAAIKLLAVAQALDQIAMSAVFLPCYLRVALLKQGNIMGNLRAVA
jgi:hypothetical protein